MVLENRIVDLASMYSLLGRVGSLPILRAGFLEYIKVSPSSAFLGLH
jgi:hypothetical protein